MNRHRDKLVEAAGLLGAEDRPPAALASHDIAAVEAQITDQSKLHSRLMELAKNVTAGAEEEMAVAAKVLCGICEEFGDETGDAETVA